MIEETKLIAGKYKIPVTLNYENGRIFFKFGFNKTLMTEIKAMEDSKWHGYDETNPRKVWSIKDNGRNKFQLDYLKGNNPYAHYDKPLIEVTTERTLFAHQLEMKAHGLTRKQCVLACEPGTGKTLAAIEIMEASGFSDWLYVGPLSAVKAVEYELKKWKSKIQPTMMTYEQVVKLIKNWPDGQKTLRGVIFDESSRIKNPTTQRSQAIFAYAEGIRNDWGDEGYIILMSGTPAPKAPTDWWNQCQTAKPGFLREGTLNKFKQRLALIVEKESLAGGVYPHIITWLDSEEKCGACGQLKDSENHGAFALAMAATDAHAFIPGSNEVGKLYDRMRGLVLVKLKRTCLDLPEKVYKIIKCVTPESIKRLAKIIKVKSSRAIEALTLLRELSDGFQYVEEPDGVEECPCCNGYKLIEEYFNPTEVEQPITQEAIDSGKLQKRTVTCNVCGGKGETQKLKRVTKYLDTPKEAELVTLLEQHEECGRIVIYAGFTGSVDRCVEVCHREGWFVIRVDGRGWQITDSQNNPIDTEAIELFQDKLEDFPRVAFIAHPQSGGLGLTLTASPTIVYYSNDFNAESRQQSEERIHRPGMDLNLGATIIDIVNLETDEIVLENLKKKKDLQSLTMGELQNILHERERN